jgi:hypothetical protein
MPSNEFSPAQIEQVCAWRAESLTSDAMLERIRDQAGEEAGPPWPEAVTVAMLEDVLAANRLAQTRMLARRRQSTVGFGSLAERPSQVSAAVDRLLVLDRKIALREGEFDALVRDGAFSVRPCICEAQLAAVNSLYRAIFGGEVNDRAAGRAPHTRGLSLSEALLKRAVALGREISALRAARAKEAALLARLTGAGTQRDVMESVDDDS